MEIKDMFGNVLNIGDKICFTISMRVDQKPIVCAEIVGFECGKNEWIVLGDYRPSSDVEWGRRENKLIKKVAPHRVVKCY